VTLVPRIRQRRHESRFVRIMLGGVASTSRDRFLGPMSKNPLFSSYRTGENRVTASIVAVLERIDLSLVERLLSSATEETDLQMVSFQNQVAAGKGSVPDAGISAKFRYLFEVKTSPHALRADQLEQHLRILDGKFEDERLFVLTPDYAEPEVIGYLDSPKLAWLSFHALDQAIASALQAEEELLGEQTRFLLYELRALFAHEGLLGQENTVVVAARTAYPEYLKTAAYACQPGRAFREGITRMGFYNKGWIRPEIPLIRHRRDNVTLSEEYAATLHESGDPLDAELADLIPVMLEVSKRVEGQQYQVFLLSKPNDTKQTLKLRQPIENTTTDYKGNTWAWTMSQRYVQSAALQKDPATTAELERFEG
jgi:hypothetical protein